jgi:GH15 family glucan-1,4-alpha-glucosidase
MTRRAAPLIAEHGLIGDLQTAALVSTDGEIDWLCMPRFDSPSVFGSLLDTEKGGYFRIHPADEGYTSRQMYLPDSAVLVTRFMSTEGVAEVIDFMPVSDQQRSTSHHRLVRIVRVVRGQMNLEFELFPAFDYGRAEHELQLTEDGVVFRSAAGQLTVHTGKWLAPVKPEQIDGPKGPGLRETITLKVGQIGGAILEFGTDEGPHQVSTEEARRLFDESIAFWRGWLGRSTYRGRWREQVNRSAITLKLLTYAPTGALVAAPTTGLPEQIGGERNWDYRYTWIRDASFSVYALLGLGFVDEASAFMNWLFDRVHEQAGSTSGPLKIMYRVDGSSDLTEQSLDHLSGYRGSRPVRIGNGAADQLQLDIYGEALDSIYFADQHGVGTPHRGWTELSGMLDWLAEHWDQPDAGVWETRGGPQDFVYSRINSWAAFDRAIRYAIERGRPSSLQRWIIERDNIYTQVMTNGWNEKVGAFVQHYGTDVLDASVLRMAQVGMVLPTDPMWLSTLRAMDKELVSDSLVYRYNPEASPDGLRGSEGTFSLCTFWYVHALAQAGRLSDARLVFEKMLTYANHLGLFAEEIGLTGEQLGNFPQAFTHLSLINAALALDDALDRAGGNGPLRSFIFDT